MTDLAARARLRCAATATDSTPASTSTSRKATAMPKGDRWRTLNSFVDVIAPHLKPATRWVWITMFRRARDGRCETTVRKLAAATGMDKATASRALTTLTRAGLVWVIWHARDKGRDSAYGIHPTPADCLAKIMRRRPR
jgi:hypothetical protein